MTETRTSTEKYSCTDCGQVVRLVDQPAHNNAVHRPPVDYSVLTAEQIEFAIEYLVEHFKQAESEGFFRVGGRARTAVHELRMEQANRALDWAMAR